MSKDQDKTKVTRITASDSASSSKPKTDSKKRSAKLRGPRREKTDRKKRSFGIFGRVGGYFKGAWFELRQVHWPTRKATWGLTSAVLLFSAFFVVFITLLDAGFKYVFEQILR